MKSNALVFDNTDSNVTGEATANLKNEQFKVEMLAHPKDFSPLSVRTPVGAEGTFADPHIAIDPVTGHRAGSGRGGSRRAPDPVGGHNPAAGPWEGKDSPCAALLNQAQKRK